MITTSGYLGGQLIVALPKRGSHEFLESVIFICRHDKGGAMGFVINQTLEGVRLYDLIEHADTKVSLENALPYNPPIFWGGPMEINRGFVLHSMNFHIDHTIPVTQDYGITPSFDILKAMQNQENPPLHSTLLLGYAGWKSGQLEKEIMKQSWVCLPCTPDLLFTVPANQKWDAAMNQIGADRLLFSPFHGKA